MKYKFKENDKVIVNTIKYPSAFGEVATVAMTANVAGSAYYTLVIEREYNFNQYLFLQEEDLLPCEDHKDDFEGTMEFLL